MKKFLVSALTLIVISAFCPASFAQEADYKKEVEALMSDFVKLWNADDSVSLRKNLAENVVVAKGHSHLVGINAIMNGYVMKQMNTTKDFTIVKVDGEDQIGNMAMQSGKWSAKTTEGATLGGEYTLMWTKREGAWKLKTMHIEEK